MTLSLGSLCAKLTTSFRLFFDYNYATQMRHWCSIFHVATIFDFVWVQCTQCERIFGENEFWWVFRQWNAIWYFRWGGLGGRGGRAEMMTVTADLDIARVNAFILFEDFRKKHADIPELQRPDRYGQLDFTTTELIRQLANLDVHADVSLV